MNLLGNFFLYFGTAALLLVIGVFLFEVTTKIKEFKLIAEKNVAVALLLTGKLLGLAIVLYSAISNSISLWDMVTWGGVAIVTQIIAFYLAEWLTPKFNIQQAIEENNIAVGLFLLGMSVSIGLIIAGSLTY